MIYLFIIFSNQKTFDTRNFKCHNYVAYGDIMEKNSLNVYSFHVTTKFHDAAILPAFKGATLRGAFGIALKNTVCINKKIQNCNDCFISSHCAYKKIFCVDVSRKDNTFNVPVPVILEPPYEKQTFYKQGSLFSFHCIIVEKIIDYFPYLIVAFKTMGDQGIGIKPNRARFELIKIKNANRIIYDEKSQMLKDYKKPVKIKTSARNGNTITLEFISPVRVKSNGNLVEGLPFPLLIKILLRRISLLKKIYSEGENLNIDCEKLIEKSFSVEVVCSSLKWYDWQRYSTRQKIRMKLGGLVGKITYYGEIQEFLPYLKIGELIRVGKNTSFGLGKYVIIE